MRGGRAKVAIAVNIAALVAPVGSSSATPLVQSHPEGKAHGVDYRSSSTGEFAGEDSTVVACPTGEVATGGGALFDQTTGDIILTDAGPNHLAQKVPARRSFAATGDSAPSGNTLVADAACIQSDGVVQRSRTPAGVTTTGQVFNAKASCPHGTSVTGGGVSATGGEDAILVSAPLDGHDADHKPDDGWRAAVVPGGDFETVTAYAVCASGLHLRYAKEVDVASTGDANSAVCPARSVDVGGGAAIDGGPNALLIGSSPLDFGDSNTTPEDGWFARLNIGSGTRTITTWAICRLY
jgi:hypothetical protein